MVLAMAIAMVAGSANMPRPTMTQHVPEAVARGTAMRVAAADPAQTLELAISLPPRNEAALQAFLRAVYDPASPEYHHYLSVAQFTAAFGPSEADYAALARFAVANGLQPRAFAANRRVLDVSAPVATVERALHVRIGTYRDPAAPRTFFAPDREPTLALGVPVLHVAGLDDAELPVSHLVRPAEAGPELAQGTGSGPNGDLIGSDVRAAYYGSGALDGSGQSVGLFEFAGFERSDVRRYFQTVGQTNTVPISAVSLNGASVRCTGKCDDGEQALDIEEALSLAPGLAHLVVYVGKNAVSIVNAMASDDTSAQLSCSWGFKVDPGELDPIFEELAAQGQSFLVATGDDGYQLKKGVVWPADDHLVTAVGGTDLRTNGPGGPWLGEVGWKESGGGPSPDNVPIPAYQVPFITAQNGGSTTLRNVPDIAGDANVDNFSCYDGACYPGNGGTSYAAPIWAGFLALANQSAANAGLAPLGFLNPAIYRIGATDRYGIRFHDQRFGDNGAYAAGPGFDLVTGFGSPHGDATIDALTHDR